MKLCIFTITTAALLLSQCSHSVKPYSSKQEARRVEAREAETTMEQLVFKDGKEAGQADKASGGPDSYRRHSPLYTPHTERAFADGYREGYHAGDTTAAAPNASTAAPRDEGYESGYDRGTRDRARRKAADPDAYVGDYDPQLRASFERGYADGFNGTR
ncbi:MAG: hypothetical protein K1X78_17160 [Verrucomicrobiaceae bacterium]|nr:hypothetical protein [Verrucomicrobiaceae bacterium]